VSVYEAAFSPGANAYASPGYASPNALYPVSPVYGSPASPIYGQGGGINKVQSPIYGNTYASPIYQGANEMQSGPQSPGIYSGIASGQSSPNYSPTNPSAR